jgi:hypothetical protein
MMKPHPSLTFLAAAAMAPLSIHATSFSGLLQQLEVSEPESIVFVDLEGDFSKAAGLLNQLYLAKVANQPDMPPIPVDFNQIFARLGLSSLEQLLFVSHQHPSGTGFFNEFALAFDSIPDGLFRLPGTSNQPFTAAAEVPADTDILIEARFQANALLDIVLNFAGDIMGPMGTELINAQLATPVLPDGTTIAKAIQLLSTRVVFAAKTSIDPAIPELAGLGDFALRIDGAGPAVAGLMQVLKQQSAVTIMESTTEDGGTEWVLHSSDMPPGLRIFVQLPHNSANLYIAPSQSAIAWLNGGSANALALQPAFIAKASSVPASGLAFTYTSANAAKMGIAPLQALANDPQLQASMEIILNAFTANAADEVSALYIDDNLLRMRAHQQLSSKSGLGLAALTLLSFVDPADFFNDDEAAAEEAGEDIPQD